MQREFDGNFEVLTRRDHCLFQVGKKESNRHKQIYDVNSIVDFVLASFKEGLITLTEEQVRIYECIDDALKKNSDLIEQHVDRRIQLFFMQLISVYRMPYYFEWVEAQDEYGKGGNYRIRKGSNKIFQTEAAHPSTLPSLIAYPRDKWQKYVRCEENKPKGFVYLKYSHSYKQHNATLELARCVNQADCLIDGTHKSSKLRNEAIKIVNYVAEGKVEPCKAMRSFMKEMRRIIIVEKKKCEKDPRSIVLGLYLDRLDNIAAVMNKDTGYFDLLVGVRIEHKREEILRSVVYQPRFFLIQQAEAIESKIARSILNAQNTMMKKSSKSLKTTDYRLRYVLLEGTDLRLKRILERLFCASLDQLQSGLERNSERLRNFERIEKIASFRENHRSEIKKLKRKLKRYFLELDNIELNYRSFLFKGLREKLNGWTQQQFSKKYKKKYEDPMSVSTVSRIEQRTRSFNGGKVYATPLCQRRKDIGEKKALRIANVYGVDPGLFLPGVLSSRY